MNIGELSARSGVPASALRYWEKAGVLSKPLRAGGQRRYGTDAAHQVAVIRLAQACGFSLDEMRDLLHGFRPGVPASRRWQELAKKKQVELDAQMGRIREMRQLVDRVLQCQCVDLSECGRRAASAMASGK